MFKYKAVDYFTQEWIYGEEAYTSVGFQWLDDHKVIHGTVCERVTKTKSHYGNNEIPLYDGDIVNENGCFITWDDDLLCWAFEHTNDGIKTPIFHDRSGFHNIEEIYGNIKFKKDLEV